MNATIAPIITKPCPKLALGDWSTAELAPNPRPQCKACHTFAPTIDGMCVRHMTQRTEIALHTVSAEDVLAAGL